MLNEVKHLAKKRGEILRFAQNDRIEVTRSQIVFGDERQGWYFLQLVPKFNLGTRAEGNLREFNDAMKKMLVTGSSGLIGSQVSEYFDAEGWKVHGIDSNQRAVFFGPEGDTRWRQNQLQTTLRNFISTLS